MREFIALETFGGNVVIRWNPDAVQLSFDVTDSGEKKEGFQLSFDGKEALKVISFINSL